jgi:tetratricopeptide (TPR) repeat protein
VETADGHLQLTVRGDDVSPKTFIGDADDLEGLASNAAEYIYGEADPYLLAAYLSTSGRPAQALDFIAKAFPQAKPEDQPELLNQWGNALFALDKPQEAVEKYRGAIVLKPDFWKAWATSSALQHPPRAKRQPLRLRSKCSSALRSTLPAINRN